MKKTIMGNAVKQKNDDDSNEDWLNIETLVDVEITSEAKEYPIESALLIGDNQGWRAGRAGEQTVRLRFKQSQALQSIMLKFEELKLERTQEYRLSCTDESGIIHEIVRQQWNFSPMGSTKQVENHIINLDKVNLIELIITPDINRTDSYATLQALRIS
ncbi:hypothetical protein GCM10007916_34650 [Psychromonas marina]|uniref:Carbohydrate-binding protein n=1 Tax=Psychromonas marina TaxID=88364 RepID=A0ABQ6E561_9GAMM|nr:hypothetical protein [Psychromonas marina]GLS92394.1 hypothetical protein GCM10007916_34650 [Psychromonas marina]